MELLLQEVVAVVEGVMILVYQFLVVQEDQEVVEMVCKTLIQVEEVLEDQMEQLTLEEVEEAVVKLIHLNREAQVLLL
jgi:hypothetical protein